MLLPAAALAVGILFANVCPLERGDLIVPAALALALAGLTVFAARWRTAAGCAALALLGMVIQIHHRPGRTPALNADDGETVLLSGCVTNPPVFSPNREQFTLNLSPAAAIRIAANLKNDEQMALHYGQQVELPAKVRSPRNFQNPESFDYAHYLAQQHIYWTGSLSNVEEIKVLPGTCGSAALAELYTARTWALGRLAKIYAPDQQTVGLLQATLLGETGGVDRRWTNDFRVSGTYHALVISGQHVSVLAFTLLFILRLFRLRKIPALCVATLASWLYAFISGMSSPVVRAAGGFTLFLMASLCFRKTRILNVLAVVGTGYLIYDPQQLFDPSFQLSFLSAAAIAAFAIPAMEGSTETWRIAAKYLGQVRYDPLIPITSGPLRVELRLLADTLQAWSPLHRKASVFVVSRGALFAAFVAEAVIVSACVQFGLALPMVSYFHRLSITGLSANIVVIPLLSLVVPLGFATLLTGWHWLAGLTGALLRAAELVATWHVRFEPAWRIAAVPVAVAVSFGISLILLAYAVRRSRFVALALAFSLSLFLVICIQPWSMRFEPGKLEVTAIDVSQGDSLLVVFPDGQTMLVDAGGFPGFGAMTRKPQIDMGEDVISPYLWSRHIKRLDYAVLTHGHSDHMGGLAAVLDNFSPRTLWIGAEPDTAEWRALQRRAAQDHVSIQPLTRASVERTIGGVLLRVLSPDPSYVPTDKPVNDDSLVFDLQYGNRRVLFTGDAEAPVEADLESAGILRPVTLLKVGHHGSKTSTTEEFLTLLKPAFALISDGYKNQFHHPHPTVLARLTEHRAAVLRTDERGLITFRTDGKTVELETVR